VFSVRQELTFGTVQTECMSRSVKPFTEELKIPDVGSEVGIAFLVQRLATGWTVHASDPDEDDIYRTPAVRPWGPPSPLYNGYWPSFPGVKQPRRGVDRPPHLAPKLKEDWSYTFPPLPGPS
jgi:hypothetical protein